MAKLTVYFKDKAIQSGWFEKDTISIGRHETNDLSIDSLAVAPFHAVILIEGEACAIKNINDDFLLTLNGATIRESPINDGDTIHLGKHKIVFNTLAREDQFFTPSHNALVNDAAENRFANRSLLTGSFQILDGDNIGKIIPIKKGITPIGHSGQGIVAVSKRKNGFFISILITLNEVPLNEASIQLNHKDVLVINNRSLQFFISES